MNYEYARRRLVTQTGAKSKLGARQLGRDQTLDEPLPPETLPPPFTSWHWHFNVSYKQQKLLNLFNSFRVT